MVVVVVAVAQRTGQPPSADNEKKISLGLVFFLPLVTLCLSCVAGVPTSGSGKVWCFYSCFAIMVHHQFRSLLFL